MKWRIIFIFFIISIFIVKDSSAQIEKRNHIIVLIDNSGDMDRPSRGGFSTTQLSGLIKRELPKILYDKDNPLKAGQKLLTDKDYLTVYFCGVNNETSPTPYNYFNSYLGVEFYQINKPDLQIKIDRLYFSNLFNKHFAGMTLAKQLALYRLGNIEGKQKHVDHTYFLILSDNQLNSKDITTELNNSPFIRTVRTQVRNIYENVESSYSIPTSQSKLISSVRLQNGRRRGWSILEIKPNVVQADFNIRSLLLEYNSSLVLERTDNWNYKGNYHVVLNPSKKDKYKITNLRWSFIDVKSKKELTKGNITEIDDNFNIPLVLKNPISNINNYKLQITYNILLKDVYGSTVVSPKSSRFDKTDNLSMEINVYPEKSAMIFGAFKLPAMLYKPVFGGQEGNVIAWNLIFSLIIILIIILILRQVYIHQLTKPTKKVITTID